MRISRFSAIAGLVTAALLTVSTAEAADSTSDKTKMNDNGGVTSQPGGKTSDRTPNKTPDRETGAGTTGAPGTDMGKTPEGTSTRSPDKTNGNN
jgi:hypothetical protein